MKLQASGAEDTMAEVSDMIVTLTDSMAVLFLLLLILTKMIEFDTLMTLTGCAPNITEVTLLP